MTATRVLLPLVLAATFAPVRAQIVDPAMLIDLERRLAVDPDNLSVANEYRRVVIHTRQYERAIRFFEALVGTHPEAANAHLNCGFAYVDKIPTAGSITQVILANAALSEFSRAIDLQPTWIGYYTRGASYLFWPRIFGRAPLGIADLEEALRIQQREPKRPYHMRTFVALGDGYWKLGDLEHARDVWTTGLRAFPDCKALDARLHADAAQLARILDAAFDPSRRVDTDLRELWSEQ
jgi:tetratricopeptide (TPR) repeat protein